MKENGPEQLINILGLGIIDFEFSLKLSKAEELSYKISFEKIKNEKGIESILQKDELLQKCSINIRNFLCNMLVFLNKTSKHQNVIDIISLNCLNVENDKYPKLKSKIFSFLKEDLNSVIDSMIIDSKGLFFKLSNEHQEHKIVMIDYFNQSDKKCNDIRLENTDKLINNLGGNHEVKENNNHSNNEKESDDYTLMAKSNDQLNSLQYDFTEVNYVFIDLSLMLEISKTLDFANFFKYIRSKVNHNSSLITFFPKIHHINKENAGFIMYFLSISDITIYDVYDLTAFSKLIGLKSEEKNLEILFLKEVKKIKKKPCKIGIFFDNFHSKLSVLIQETTNLVVYHKDFKYDFKKDSEDLTYMTITQNKDYFKSVFFGGFFSKIVKKKSYEIAFEAGCEIVRRMTKLFIIGNHIPLNREYYIVLVPSKRKKKNNKENEIVKMKESNFVLDCTNSNLSKLRSYNPLFDGHLSSFFSSDVTKKHLKKQKFINKKGFILDDPDSKSIENRVIRDSNIISKFRSNFDKTPDLLNIYHEEQNKLYSIKDSNERMKLQLNHLFNNTDKVNERDMLYLGKLPKLQNIEKLAEKKLPCMDFSKSLRNKKPNQEKQMNATCQNFGVKKNNLTEYDNAFPKEKLKQLEEITNLDSISKQNYNKFLKMFEEKVQNIVNYPEIRTFSKSSNEKFRSKSNKIFISK